MYFLLKTAFRNLTRYKKRTMITAGAISYGLIMFIAIQSLLTGINKESETNLRLYETATGRITTPEYWEERDTFPLKESFNPEIIIPILNDSDAAYSPRIKFAGNLIFYKEPFPEDGSIPGIFTAIDTKKDTEVFKLKEFLCKGEWLKEEEPGLLLGYWLAQDIGAEIGSTVLVETQTRDGYAQVIDLTISGFLNCPNPEITRSGIFLPIDIADEYLEMNGNVTEINVNFGNSRKENNQFAALAEKVGEAGLKAIGRRELGSDFYAISQAKAAGTGAVVFLILIIAAVGISNTMLMAVFERVRELGMMRALGMSAREIRLLFIMEAAGIGILGGICGVVAGAAVTWPLIKWGINYSALLRESSFGYRIQGHLYGVWDFKSMAAAFLLSVGLAVLVTVFSTRRIMKMDIPSSLRFG